MSQYLEEAARQLRKAAESTNRMSDYHRQVAARERIAARFAQLAAIEKGLISQELVGDLVAAPARDESGGWSR